MGVLSRGIGERVDQRAVLIKRDAAAGGFEFEIAVQVIRGGTAIGLEAVVAHHDEKSAGSERGASGKRPLRRLRRRIRERPAGEINGGSGGVAQFDPIACLVRVLVVFVFARRLGKGRGDECGVHHDAGGLVMADEVTPRAGCRAAADECGASEKAQRGIEAQTGGEVVVVDLDGEHVGAGDEDGIGWDGEQIAGSRGRGRIVGALNGIDVVFRGPEVFACDLDAVHISDEAVIVVDEQPQQRGGCSLGRIDGEFFAQVERVGFAAHRCREIRAESGATVAEGRVSGAPRAGIEAWRVPRRAAANRWHAGCRPFHDALAGIGRELAQNHLGGQF